MAQSRSETFQYYMILYNDEAQSSRVDFNEDNQLNNAAEMHSEIAAAADQKVLAHLTRPSFNRKVNIDFCLIRHYPSLLFRHFLPIKSQPDQQVLFLFALHRQEITE